MITLTLPLRAAARRSFWSPMAAEGVAATVACSPAGASKIRSAAEAVAVLDSYLVAAEPAEERCADLGDDDGDGFARIILRLRAARCDEQQAECRAD